MDSYHISHIYWESNMGANMIANVVVKCDLKMSWQGERGMPMDIMSRVEYDIMDGKEGLIINGYGSTLKGFLNYYVVPI